MLMDVKQKNTNKSQKWGRILSLSLLIFLQSIPVMANGDVSLRESMHAFRQIQRYQSVHSQRYESIILPLMQTGALAMGLATLNNISDVQGEIDSILENYQKGSRSAAVRERREQRLRSARGSLKGLGQLTAIFAAGLGIVEDVTYSYQSGDSIDLGSIAGRAVDSFVLGLLGAKPAAAATLTETYAEHPVAFLELFLNSGEDEAMSHLNSSAELRALTYDFWSFISAIDGVLSDESTTRFQNNYRQNNVHSPSRVQPEVSTTQVNSAI